MTLDASGNLGIGTTTPSTYGLITAQTYAGTSAIPFFALGNAASLSSIVLRNLYTRANGVLNGLEFRDSANEVQAGVWANATGSNNQSNLVFGTNNGTGGNGLASLTERARITPDGNLLVGQTVAGTQKVAWSGSNCGDTTTVAWGNVASTTINLASILPSLGVASGNTLNVTLQIVTSSSTTSASVANILCMRKGDLTWSFTTLGVSASNAVTITPTGSGAVITLTFSSGAQYGVSRVQAVSF
jgi:hypothetical protein